MRRYCNLELSLLPFSASFSLGKNGEMNNPQEQERMTFFYNGRICVCNVTELQARSIIWLARRRTEEIMSRSPKGETNSSNPPTPQSNKLYSPTGGSMTRSLQQFFEKRRNRIQASSPYQR